MSSFYVLCPPRETTWRCDLEDFTAAVLEQWPNAALRRTALPTAAVEWELKADESSWLDGSLDQHRQACYLRGAPNLVVDFVLWFRGRNPEPELALVCDAAGVVHSVGMQPSRDEILQML